MEIGVLNLRVSDHIDCQTLDRAFVGFQSGILPILHLMDRIVAQHAARLDPADRKVLRILDLQEMLPEQLLVGILVRSVRNQRCDLLHRKIKCNFALMVVAVPAVCGVMQNTGIIL